MLRIRGPVMSGLMLLAASGFVVAQSGPMYSSASGRAGFVPRHLRNAPTAERVATRTTPVRSAPASNTPTKSVSANTGEAVFTDHDPLPEFTTTQTTTADHHTMMEPSPTFESIGYDPNCQSGCEPCGTSSSCSPCGSMIWGRVEYLSWWMSGGRPPVLATTSLAGSEREVAGVLGQPGTETLFGGNSLFDDYHSNVRYTLGWWCDGSQTRGIEASYFSLDDEETFAVSDLSSGIIARPFYNASTTLEDSRLVDFPDLVDGSLDIFADTDFRTFEVSLRQASAYSVGCGRLDFLLGYRYAGLDDQLRINEQTTSLVAPLIGATFDLTDRFETENTFHGGQLGLKYTSASMSCFQLELVGKVALGNSRSKAIISGETTTQAPGAAASTQTGGLLTQRSNIGTFESDDFAAISEFGAAIKGELRPGISATLGYAIMSWSDVLRAGTIMDGTVNPTQIPPGTLTGDSRPTPMVETSSFWAHGLNAGIEISY